MSAQVICLPSRTEEIISTIEDGFLIALATQEVTLMCYKNIGNDHTIVIMSGMNDQYLAVRMDEEVEPVDLTLAQFDKEFHGDSWKMWTKV